MSAGRKKIRRIMGLIAQTKATTDMIPAKKGTVLINI
jgi:hypothetical protein